MWVQCAGVAVTGALWGLAVLWVRRRPEPDGPLDRPEPGRLPDALADVVLQNGKVTDSAVEAGLRDLERDGWIGSVTHDDGTVSVYPRAPDQPVSLRLYQGLLLERIRARRGDRLSVPATALGPGDGSDHVVWWQRYREALADEAVAADLVRPSSPGRRLLLGVAQVAVGLSVAWLVDALRHHVVLDLVSGFTAWLLLGTTGAQASAPLLSPQGREAAAWWRAADVQSLAAAPQLQPDQVWSGAGGRWRVVQVAPVGRSVGGGVAGLLALFGVLGLAELLLLAVDVADGWLQLLPLAVAVPATAYWIPRFRRRIRLPAWTSLSGEVVRRWTYETETDNSTRTHWCIAVDDGVAAVAPSFEVARAQWEQLPLGSRLRVEYSPRSGRVRGLWPS